MMNDGSATRWMSRYWLLVPMTLAAILIGNWVEQPETLAPQTPMAIATTPADYLLEDFTTRHYDPSGVLAYVLTGNTLAHYPDDGRAEITQPQVTLQRDNTHWTVVADTGRLTREPDIVTLLGAVTIDRTVQVNDDEMPVRISASNVEIALDTDYLQTQYPVVIEAPGMLLKANGLQSSIKEGKLELNSGVSARYEVAPRTSNTGSLR